jgi:glycosyltransferase involved in cell wall biosynthesis
MGQLSKTPKQIKMNISVILPAYNAADYIHDAIDSILQQQFKGTFELIIVNDCSTDKTSEILEAYRTDERVRIFKTERNTGYPGAMNLGLKHARGKYISRMDADDVVDPALLQMTFDFHEVMGDDVAFVSCRRYWISYSGKPYHKSYDSRGEHIREYWQDLIDRKRAFTDVGSLFRRSIAEAVGGYNDYQRSGMDVDLWLRIMEYTEKPCLTLIHPLVGKRLLPESIIFRPNTTNANNIPRELALFRRSRSLPPHHKPSKDWLAEVRKEFPENRNTIRKVSLSMEVALTNRWLGDQQGYLAFLRLSMKRNPLMTLKILLRSLLLGWKHDFIQGRPALEALTMKIGPGSKMTSTVSEMSLTDHSQSLQS